LVKPGFLQQRHELFFWCRFRSRTPGPPPFSFDELDTGAAKAG
jgi:hypothetical protein